MPDTILNDFDQYSLEFIQSEFEARSPCKEDEFTEAVEGLNTFLSILRNQPGLLAVTNKQGKH